MITRDWVRAHGGFGNSNFHNKPNDDGLDNWGSRKSSKFVRCYLKKELNALRVETELHSRFLRRYGITSPFDFFKLVDVLPLRHISFSRLDYGKIKSRLARMGFTAADQRKILTTLATMRGDLGESLAYLRRKVKLKNTQRFLIPLHMNAGIANALRKWAAMWPTAPAKLNLESRSASKYVKERSA